MLHTYLLDLHHGEMYQVRFEGDRDAIDDFLRQLASQGCIGHDIRFIRSTPPGKKDKGFRQIPCGRVANCKFKYDKLNTFNGGEQNGQRNIKGNY